MTVHEDARRDVQRHDLDYDIEDVVVVSTNSQLKAIADNTRMHILNLLMECSATVTQLAKALEKPKGTVGYHTKVLEDAGMIRIVRTNKVRAMTVKYYGRTGRTILLEKYRSRMTRCGSSTMHCEVSVTRRGNHCRCSPPVWLELRWVLPLSSHTASWSWQKSSQPCHGVARPSTDSSPVSTRLTSPDSQMSRVQMTDIAESSDKAARQKIRLGVPMGRSSAHQGEDRICTD